MKEEEIDGSEGMGWKAIRRRRQLMIRLALGPARAPDPVEALDKAAREVPLELLHQNGLAPLTFHQWAYLRASLGPSGGAWLDRLRELLHADAAAMLSMERRWAGLLRASEEARFEFCLLKGSAQRAVGRSVPGRTQGDLDLLVRNEELERAETFLYSRGYRLRTEYRSREGYFQDHFHFPMIGPEGHVELHWSLGRRVPEGAMDRLWERSREIEVEGTSVRILSSPDRLLHSCIHISEHAFGGMARWLAELAIELRALGPRESAVFLEEARRWPPRAMWAPLHFLGRWGEEVGSSLGSSLEHSAPVRSPLLAGAMTAAAFGDGLPGVPHQVLVNALESWFREARPFPVALGKAYLAGVGQKVRGDRAPQMGFQVDLPGEGGRDPAP